MFINGIQADLTVYDVFSLLDTLLGEAKLMEGLYSLGIQVVRWVVGITLKQLLTKSIHSLMCPVKLVE